MVSAVGLRSYFMKVFFVIFLQLLLCHILYFVNILILRPKAFLVFVGSRSYFMKGFFCYICKTIILFYTLGKMDFSMQCKVTDAD